jgi:hypothetical protein
MAPISSRSSFKPEIIDKRAASTILYYQQSPQCLSYAPFLCHQHNTLAGLWLSLDHMSGHPHLCSSRWPLLPPLPCSSLYPGPGGFHIIALVFRVAIDIDGNRGTLGRGSLGQGKKETGKNYSSCHIATMSGRSFSTQNCRTQGSQVDSFRVQTNPGNNHKNERGL